MSIFRYLVDSRTDSKNTKKLISNNFYILRFCLILFLVLYLGVCLFIDIPYKWIILADIIVCVLSGNFLQISRGLGKITDFSISCILTGLTTVISNIILICFVGLKSEGMIISMALANGICSLYLFVRLKLYKYIDFKLVDKKLIKDMYKYSLPLVPNGISWWIVNISDRTIISFILGAGANGLYAISNKFPTVISSLTGVFNLSWSESAALHINSEDRDEFFTDITNTVIKLFTALGIGMIACMPFVFPLMVNKQYADAYNYIPFLVLATVFNVVICLYSQVYLAKKLSKQVATTAIMGAIINIVINVVLIKPLGIYAAALSTTISYFVMMLYRHIDLKKYINIKIETSLIIKTIIMFSITIFVYYLNNIWLNIINLIIVLIYCVLLNKVFLFSTYKTVLGKLKR
jgi:O-antigen/teichoic acid export membrane protein